MHARSKEVLDYLDAQRNDLRAAVDAVPVNARNTQPAPDRWSVAQVLEHVAIVHDRVAIGVSKWIAEARQKGLGPETETSSLLKSIPSALVLDRTRRFEAPEAIRPGKDVDADSAWTQLEQARENLRAAFLTGDGLALEQVVEAHPVLGPINVYQWVLFNASHEARHILQIREIAQGFNSAAGGRS